MTLSWQHQQAKDRRSAPQRRAGCAMVAVVITCAVAASAAVAAPPEGYSKDQVAGAIREVLSGRHPRKKVVALLRAAIEHEPRHERVMEAEYYVAQLWLGECCKESADVARFVSEVDRIRAAYGNDATHTRTYWYLELQITYAQAIADNCPGLSDRLMWEVAKFPPSQMVVPQEGPWWKSKAGRVRV